MKTVYALLVAVLFASTLPTLVAEGLDPATQAKIDAQIKVIQGWASDPVLVNAVKEHNKSVPADQAALTQDDWKGLSILSLIVRSFTKNEAGAFLKAHKTVVITEAFISDKNGLKVGFLAKTSGWSHKGKPKHEVPMTGKTWQGAVELDESTGLQQVQVAVPVLDGKEAVGSLVVGLGLSKLSE